MKFHKGEFSIELEVGSWWFSLYFTPDVWGWGFHYKAECCKFWLLLGCFEINQMYSEDDFPDEIA